MTKRPVRGATIRQLTSRAGIDLLEVIRDLDTTSDRGGAIIGGGLVEWSIERTILLRLAVRDDETVQRLAGRDGALHNFYSKIHLAYAMGAYDSEIKPQLEAIRRIRNLFAHSMKRIDFETNEVVIEVRKLGVPEGEADGPRDLSKHRKQFNWYCVAFFVRTMAMEMGRMAKELHDAGIEPPDEIKLKMWELIKKVRSD